MSAEFFDQIFVTLKKGLLGLLGNVLPEWLLPFAAVTLSVSAVLMAFPFIFAITTVVERKVLGRIQNRYGPNRVGLPFTNLRLAGFGQFIADGLKSLTKEDVVPYAADKVVHFLAPVVLVIPVVLSYAVLPVGRNMTALDLDAGLLFFFAAFSSRSSCTTSPRARAATTPNSAKRLP